MNPTAPASVIDRLSPLTPSSRWAPLVVAIASAVGAAAAVVIAGSIAHGTIPYPGCMWKQVTGLACPGCGGTRSLVALGHGSWGVAVALNPMAAIGAALAWTSVPLTFLDIALNRGRVAARLGKFSRTRSFTWTLMAVLAVNWAWLLLEGR